MCIRLDGRCMANSDGLVGSRKYIFTVTIWFIRPCVLGVPDMTQYGQYCARSLVLELGESDFDSANVCTRSFFDNRTKPSNSSGSARNFSV